MSDPGPSLDLARFLHRQLVRNVGLPRNFIRPGNYYVLRNNNQPAVLGEASYLSHPRTEKKLLGENARRIEAYAYLLGIVDYLSGRVPVVESLQVAGTSPVQEPCPQLSARVYDEASGLGIDPQQIEFVVDGEVLPVNYDPASGTLRVATLAGVWTAGPGAGAATLISPRRPPTRCRMTKRLMPAPWLDRRRGAAAAGRRCPRSGRRGAAG